MASSFRYAWRYPLCLTKRFLRFLFANVARPLAHQYIDVLRCLDRQAFGRLRFRSYLHFWHLRQVLLATRVPERHQSTRWDLAYRQEGQRMILFWDGRRVAPAYLDYCEIRGSLLWLSWNQYNSANGHKKLKKRMSGRPREVEFCLTDQSEIITKENVYKCKRFLICYLKMVTPRRVELRLPG